METAEFVEHAPLYYALAIAAQLNNRNTLSRRAIEAAFSVDDEGEDICLVKLAPVWKAAIDWLNERQMIIEVKGAFGPSLYCKSEAFDREWASLLDNKSPFNIFRLVDDKDAWLFAALRDVQDNYEILELSPDDFERPDHEWEPIQIETSEPSLSNTIETLSDAIEKIRNDNGYAANFPEERDFVVGGLTGTVEKLKTGSISAGYLRDAWNKLTIVSRRFAGAALELVSSGAQQAIIELVKSQGGELLRSLLNLFH
jgi:hypothetical protein